MNKDNVAHFSGGEWCDGCATRCPFDATYGQSQQRLFGGSVAPLAGPGKGRGPATPGPPVAMGGLEGLPTRERAVWVHDAALSPEDVALCTDPAAAVFVFDATRLAREPWAFRRLASGFDGVGELFAAIPHPVKLAVVGDPAGVFRALGVRELLVTDSPNPSVRGRLADLAGVTVRTLPRPRLANYAGEPRRFSRYWEAVAPRVLGHNPARGKVR